MLYHSTADNGMRTSSNRLFRLILLHRITSMERKSQNLLFQFCWSGSIMIKFQNKTTHLHSLESSQPRLCTRPDSRRERFLHHRCAHHTAAVILPSYRAGSQHLTPGWGEGHTAVTARRRAFPFAILLRCFRIGFCGCVRHVVFVYSAALISVGAGVVIAGWFELITWKWIYEREFVSLLGGSLASMLGSLNTGKNQSDCTNCLKSFKNWFLSSFIPELSSPSESKIIFLFFRFCCILAACLEAALGFLVDGFFPTTSSSSSCSLCPSAKHLKECLIECDGTAYRLSKHMGGRMCFSRNAEKGISFHWGLVLVIIQNSFLDSCQVRYSEPEGILFLLHYDKCRLDKVGKLLPREIWNTFGANLYTKRKRKKHTFFRFPKV